VDYFGAIFRLMNDKLFQVKSLMLSFKHLAKPDKIGAN